MVRTSIKGKGDMVMEDILIIDLYFERNEQAIAETQNKYGRYCYCIANNILANEQDSEECVNDTYVKTWNAIPPQKPNNLKLFLARITRNLAFDKVKNETRKKRGGNNLELALDEVSEIISDGESVEAELESKEFMKRVNSFLYMLPSRDCNVFVSRYFYLESMESIAKKYGLSVANVSKILSRTRVKLKDFLNNEGYSV